jgi:preprotein translocase subunit SecB
MSDQDSSTPVNGGEATNGGGDPDTMPQATALAQYIKDMSVENPSAPGVFQWPVQPQLDVQFNITVNRIAEEIHEAVLKITLKAVSDQGTHFVVDLAYAGLFGLRNLPDEALPPFLLIEAPRLLFPFARQIIAEQVQNLGFPPVLLDPIDFSGAYLAQVEAANGGAIGDDAVVPPSDDA